MNALKMRQGSVDGASADAPSRPEGREAFFAGLPKDDFTPDEERLREALLDFLYKWKERGVGKGEPPSLSHAGGDADVRASRAAVLPPGTPVSLKDWIEHRMGGEIEMTRSESNKEVLF